MPRRIRFIPPGSLVEITCRTVQGRLLLRPSPISNEVIVGVLARAARLYPVDVHAFAFLSNHYHLLLTVPNAQRLAAFMGYLNSNLAREVGRLVRWREKFWGRRYQAIVVSQEPEAQIERLAYLLAHGAKEGLVASPRDWPGAHAARALLAQRVVSGRWHDRTLEYRARRKELPLDPNTFVEREQLRLVPLPCWSTLDSETHRTRVEELIRSIEESCRERLREEEREPLGVAAVLRQNPHLEPNRVRRGPAPLVHAASREVRHAFRAAYRRFVESFLDAANLLKRGVFDVEFPAGAFPPAMPPRLGAGSRLAASPT